MNLMSESTNGKRSTSPVLVLVRVTMPLTYASPTKALRFVIVMGSASTGSNAAGPNTWYAPPRTGEPPGIGTGANDDASAGHGVHNPDPTVAANALPAAVRANSRREIGTGGRRAGMLWCVESVMLVRLVVFQSGIARKFTVFLLSEYHARKIVPGIEIEGTGAHDTSGQRRPQHPFFRVRIKSSK